MSWGPTAIVLLYAIICNNVRDIIEMFRELPNAKVTFANPISTFVNIEQICGAIKKHAAKQGQKMVSTQPDPKLWVYELGTNSDCSVDAIICNNERDIC